MTLTVAVILLVVQEMAIVHLDNLAIFRMDTANQGQAVIRPVLAIIRLVETKCVSKFQEQEPMSVPVMTNVKEPLPLNLPLEIIVVSMDTLK